MIQQGDIGVKLDGMSVAVYDGKIKILSQGALYDISSFCKGENGCSPFGLLKSHDDITLRLDGGNGNHTEISVSRNLFDDFASALKKMGLVIPQMSCDLCNQDSYMVGQFIEDGYSPHGF